MEQCGRVGSAAGYALIEHIRTSVHSDCEVVNTGCAGYLSPLRVNMFSGRVNVFTNLLVTSRFRRAFEPFRVILGHMSPTGEPWIGTVF
jgi:hypothetical protein